MQDTRLQSLCGEDPLEKEMTTHSCIFLPGESHGQRRLESNSPRGHKESDMTERLSTFTSAKQLGNFYRTLLSRYLRGAEAEDMGETCLRKPPWGPALLQSESLDQGAGPKLWFCPSGPRCSNISNLSPPRGSREGGIPRVTLAPEICVLRTKEWGERGAGRWGCPGKQVYKFVNEPLSFWKRDTEEQLRLPLKLPTLATIAEKSIPCFTSAHLGHHVQRWCSWEL